MAECFSPCGLCGSEDVTKADLDRYTDKLGNVLSDKKGRSLFRVFMTTSKMKDGKRALDVWEECDQVIKSMNTSMYEEFPSDVDKLVSSAEKIPGLVAATTDTLATARKNKKDPKEILTIIKLLQNEIARTMGNEYNVFREHLLQNVS